MDVVFLSRLQFGLTAFFHFLFVPLTLGLSVLVAIMETWWLHTGDEDYKRMARFWGRLFTINFAVGVVSGIVLEFQFGTNWSGFSAYVGDVFGSLLAIEATAAFFLESTFLAVWLFGWDRVSRRVHVLSIWIVAFAGVLSALWIVAANAWMQHPVGFVVNNGRAELTDLVAVVTQWFSLVSFIHVVSGAFILSGFFVAGVSAWHLMRNSEPVLFRKSFRLGIVFALIFSIFEVLQGHMNGEVVAKMQPTKLAAMESFWESGTFAPQIMFLIPDEKQERNLVEIGKIPGMLSLLAFRNVGAEVRGLKSFPKDQRPPVLPVFLSFRIMMGLGFLFPAIAALGLFMIVDEKTLDHTRLFRWLVRQRARLDKLPARWWIFVLAIPLPYVAIETGWALAEIGRQPWSVYGIMRTSESASPLAASQVAASLAGFVLLYSTLGFIDFFLLYKNAKRGPAPVEETGHA